MMTPLITLFAQMIRSSANEDIHKGVRRTLDPHSQLSLQVKA
jgi:hypothetical protein